MAELISLRLEQPSVPQKTAKRGLQGFIPSSHLFGAARISQQTRDWAMSPLSRDQKVFQALRPLRYRSRWLADNDATMKRYLNLEVSQVVGHGVRMQPKVKMQRGGKLNTDLNQLIADEWRAWGQRGICTMDGKHSWHDLEKLVMHTTPMDGESLFLKNAADNEWGFALQFLDADQLDPTYFVRWDGQREVRMGVEIDKFQRPLAYWLYSGHPSEIGNGPANRYRIPADAVVHVYSPDSARQTRGLPWATSVMHLMFQLRGFYEAAVVAARLAASVMGFIRKPTPEGELPVTNVDDERDGDPLAHRTDPDDIEAEPGTFHTLYDGEDITPFKSDFPSTAVQPFVKEVKRDIATGLQVAYVSLYDDLSDINFSSIRAGKLLERDGFRVQQSWLIESLHKPVFRSWLKSAVLAGRIPIKTSDIDVVCAQIKWHPRGWDWVDPLKDEQATVLGVQNLTTTLTRVASSKGLDLDEMIEERKEEIEKLRAAGIMAGTDNKGDATTASDDQGLGGDEDEQSQGKPGSSTDKKNSSA